MPAITLVPKCQGSGAWPDPATRDLQCSLFPRAELALSRNSVLILQKVFLLILLLLTMTQTAHAYWLESKPEPFSLREREHAPPSDGKMFFTIQDNFELFTDKIDSAPLLLPNSDYFVPADVIDINIPLFGIFSHPAKPAEDPIVNLLYANLKVKKLLDEYSEIQKRAAKLLGDESKNFHLGKIQVNTNKPIDQPQTEEENKISIYRELHNKLTKLSTSNFNELASVTSVNENHTLAKGTTSPLLSFLHLQKKTEIPSQSTRLSTHTPPDTGKISTSESGYQAPPNYSQRAEQATSKQDQSTQYSKEITLPWLLDLPFNIFNYFLVHKIQALLIALIGLLIINIIFGSRS
jgi:hypothetical protein